MKKINIIFLFVIIFVFLVSFKTTVKADNGVPYRTYTYSSSQQSLIPTQDAYIPLALINKIGSITLNSPKDITVDKDDNIYIADSKNKRVIKFSLETEEAEPVIIGEGFLEEPTGLTIDNNGYLYVTDIVKEEAYKYSYNEDTNEYQVVTTYKRPENSPLILDKEPFKPSKVVVDKGNNVYLVLSGNINGLAQYNENGEFFGYFGGNQIPATFENVLRSLLFNEQQRRTWFKMIPKPVYNVAVDQKGSLLTTTKTQTGYKKLNIGNTIISQSYFGYTNTEDLAVGPINNIFTISEDGYIIEYSADGDFLFIFGGRDVYLQKGLFKKPSAITVDSKNNIYAIDSESNALQVFYPTMFANTVHQALDLYQNGRYIESEELWKDVLKMNSLFDLAHKGLGSSYFASAEYQKSMDSYLLASDQEGYSNAYWEVRNISLLKNAQYFIIILFALFILYVINIKLRFFHYIIYPFNLINNRLKKFKLYEQLIYVFKILRHPLDGYYGIKKQNKTSVLSATILLMILYLVYIVSLYKTGFLFNDNIITKINIVQESITLLVPFILWVIANYLVSSIREGEGKFTHVYQASVYMASPMLVALPILTFVSNYLTYNESFIYEFGMFVAILVTVIYMILMVKEIHNYSASSSIVNILISIFTALMIAVFVFIVYILTSEIFRFFTDIWIEVTSRG